MFTKYQIYSTETQTFWKLLCDTLLPLSYSRWRHFEGNSWSHCGVTVVSRKVL